jgi:hypothetical protein
VGIWGWSGGKCTHSSIRLYPAKAGWRDSMSTVTSCAASATIRHREFAPDLRGPVPSTAPRRTGPESPREGEPQCETAPDGGSDAASPSQFRIPFCLTWYQARVLDRKPVDSGPLARGPGDDMEPPDKQTWRRYRTSAARPIDCTRSMRSRGLGAVGAASGVGPAAGEGPPRLRQGRHPNHRGPGRKGVQGEAFAIGAVALLPEKSGQAGTGREKLAADEPIPGTT